MATHVTLEQKAADTRKQIAAIVHNAVSGVVAASTDKVQVAPRDITLELHFTKDGELAEQGSGIFCMMNLCAKDLPLNPASDKE